MGVWLQEERSSLFPHQTLFKIFFSLWCLVYIAPPSKGGDCRFESCLGYMRFRRNFGIGIITVVLHIAVSSEFCFVNETVRSFMSNSAMSPFSMQGRASRDVSVVTCSERASSTA